MKGVEERFWDKVTKTETCWTWSAKKDKNGYGRFSPSGETSQLPAHRFSWELHNGPIPEGLLVCHHCDNPECTNPSHLFLGTPQDNMTDKVLKGRWKGNHPRRVSVTKPRTPRIGKSLEGSIEEIIEKRKSGKTLSEIATSFGCDKGVIRRMLEKRGLYEPLKPGPRTPHNVRTAEVRARKEEISNLLAAKTSVNRMAKILGVGRATTVRILKTLSVSSGSLLAA